MGEVRDIKCPVTGDVVYLDVAVLRQLYPARVVCPRCHDVHIWEPRGLELHELPLEGPGQPAHAPKGG